jgi:hypothetical protein
MKIRSAIIILALGYVLGFIGAWFKITHQAPADLTLAVSAFLKAIGVILLTVFLLAHPKIKEFLDYDKYKDSFK